MEFNLPEQTPDRLNQCRWTGRQDCYRLAKNVRPSTFFREFANPLTDTLVNLLDDAFSANLVDSSCLDDLETNVSIIVIIGRSTQSGANTRMDVGVILEKTFHGCVIEVCSVVDACHLRRGSTEDLGLPGIEVRIEVDDRDGAVGTVERAQQREGDRVVTTHGDDARQGPAMLGQAVGIGVGMRVAHEDAVVAFFDLLDCPLGVVSIGS